MANNKKANKKELGLVISYYGEIDSEQSDVELVRLCAFSEISTVVKKEISNQDPDDVSEDLNFGWIPISEIRSIPYHYRHEVEIGEIKP